jgi:hypothetical protein
MSLADAQALIIAQVSISQKQQMPNVILGGLVIALGPDEFLFAGNGLTVPFETEPRANLPLVAFQFRKVNTRMVSGFRAVG